MENKKPKYTKKEYIKCVQCNKPIYIDDLGMINKDGLWHKECYFRVCYLDSKGFIYGYETKVRKNERILGMDHLRNTFFNRFCYLSFFCRGDGFGRTNAKQL